MACRVRLCAGLGVGNVGVFVHFKLAEHMFGRGEIGCGQTN